MFLLDTFIILFSVSLIAELNNKLSEHLKEIKH